MKILIVDDVLGWRNHHKQILLEMFEGADIYTADSARAGYDLLLQHNDTPFDIIISDMQMEEDFEPKYAGEWFVEQVKTFKSYYNTKIIIVSAAYNISQIAESLGVKYIRKSTAMQFPDSYNFLKD